MNYNDEIQNSYLKMLYCNEIDRLENYDKYERYYEGNNILDIPDKFKPIIKFKYGIMSNYCNTIVNAPVAKLKIENIKSQDENTETFLKNVYKENKMNTKQTKIHRQTIEKGDCFVQVWAKEENNKIKYTIDFIRPEHCFAFYSSDSEDSLEYVVRQWIGFENNQPTAYKYIYYKDRIERYYHQSSLISADSPQAMLYTIYDSSWLPYDPDGLGSKLLNPYGVIPIIHFANKPNENAWGSSEIADAIPLQDLINSLLIDLIRTAEFQAFKQRYVKGVEAEEIPVNPTTGKKQLISNPGDVWHFASPDAEVGELGSEDLNPILTAIQNIVKEMGKITSTPSLLTDSDAGTASSGFALAKKEASLIAKCEELQTNFGNSYEQINKILCIMALFHNDLPKTADIESEVVWKDLTETSPQDRQIETQRISALKINNIISAQEALRQLNYSPEQIEQIKNEIKEEAEENIADTIGHSFADTPPTQGE